MNHGLIIKKVETKEEGAEHLLGSIKKFKGVVINPSGDWTPYIPEGELQNKGKFEPNACVSFGTNNCIETLIRFHTGQFENKSDRALAIGSGTDPNRGNDPHTVAEYARKKLGFAPEDALPFNSLIDTLEKFYSPNPLTQNIFDSAVPFNSKWEMNHEWVFLNGSAESKKKLLKEALKVGTVGVSVYAWESDGLRYTKPQGATDNHFVQLVGYDSGDCPFIFDSYAETDGTPFIKRLDPLYNFDIAKVFYLSPAQPKLSILQKILDLIKKIVGIQTVLVEKKLEEKPITPIDETPPPPVKPPEKDNLFLWAQGHRKAEGWYPGSRSWRNHNPGNLKFTEYTRGLGASGADSGNFCIFPNYATGFEALKTLLKDAATDKLKSYKSTMTIKEFCQVFALPPDNHYANVVADEIGVKPDIQIKNIL